MKTFPYECPRCGFGAIKDGKIKEGYFLTQNSGLITQECKCAMCGAKWTDLYTVKDLRYCGYSYNEV